MLRSGWIRPGFPVAMPLLALSLAFATILLGLSLATEIQLRLTKPGIIISTAAYLAAFAGLIAIGIRNFRRLERLGFTDSLCGLPNRRALHVDIKQNASQGAEVAIALIDFDDFKAINDHYGHAVGDRLIKNYAALLTELSEGTTTAYRLGGDEFALVQIGPMAGNLLEGLCRKLLILLTKPRYVDDRAIALGASIGLTRSSNEDQLDSSDLLRQADVAMYVSKTAGKMRCTWYDAAFDRDRELFQNTDNELRKALIENQFTLAYQPLISTEDESIVAVEALIRWTRPDGKNIGPNVFIPLAEKTGLINAMGLWVLRQAMLDTRDWQDIKVSVNVSAVQLRNPEFPVELGNLLEETGFDPERLELEVTETQLVIDSDVANRSLEVIRSFGVSIALDDFGTGYASIGFLRKCRFEKLKLDRTLIVDAIENESTRAMMIASITMARALNMGITAEGVETEAQAALARDAGCNQIQGWLYYKAMPAKELAALIQNRDMEHGTVKAAA